MSPFFNFDYRRLLPNGNNVAARCLDESSNMQNEKRIHINAQVTAIKSACREQGISVEFKYQNNAPVENWSFDKRHKIHQI